MGILDAFKSSFLGSVRQGKGALLGKLSQLNPFVQINAGAGVVNVIVDRKLEEAEARILDAVNAKLRAQGVLNMQDRVTAALQAQVDAEVSAILDAVPGLNIPSYSVPLNPLMLATIQVRLAAFKARMISKLMGSFTANPGAIQGMVARAAADLPMMIERGLERKLNVYGATLGIEDAIAEQVDALIDPVIDEIVAVVAAAPEIRIVL